MREGPWGSHHDEASALKWETSSGETVVKLGSGELEADVAIPRRLNVDAKERRAGLPNNEEVDVISACLGVDERALAVMEGPAVKPLEICLVG